MTIHIGTEYLFLRRTVMADNTQRLPSPTIAFHWIIAFGMIALIVFGLYIEKLPRGPEKGQLIGIHKSFGILIFLLAVLRIGWLFKTGFPIPLSQAPRWQEATAKVVRLILLAGTVLLPISGVIMSIGGGHPIGVFGQELVARSAEKNDALSQVGHVIHGLGGKLLIAALFLHIAGAFKHQFLDRDRTLARILGQRV